MTSVENRMFPVFSQAGVTESSFPLQSAASCTSRSPSCSELDSHRFRRAALDLSQSQQVFWNIKKSYFLDQMSLKSCQCEGPGCIP